MHKTFNKKKGSFLFDKLNTLYTKDKVFKNYSFVPGRSEYQCNTCRKFISVRKFNLKRH